MLIRTARPDDAARIAALLSAVWVGTYATEGVTAEIAAYVLAEFTPERVAAGLGHAGRHAWIAEEGEGVLGYVDVQLNQTTVRVDAARQAEVLHLYVHERHTGRGTGTRLLEAATEHAFAHGCEAVWLSVWERNERALHFYARRGWDSRGLMTFRLGDSDHANHVYALRARRRA